MGYDFIALTDHRIESPLCMEQDFLVLPGAEWDMGSMEEGNVCHIIGVGMERPTRDLYHTKEGVFKKPRPQEMIDAVNEAGGLAILAHPHWSLMDPEDIKNMHGIIGSEIYNSVSASPLNPDRADSSVYFDLWAKHGRLIPSMAADDSHGYHGEEGRSFIMVNAGMLTRDAVMAALREGSFYASQGPEFERVWLENGCFQVKCSADVKEVIFKSKCTWRENAVQSPVNGFASCRILPPDSYLRAELVTEDGRKAWCGPYAIPDEYRA